MKDKQFKLSIFYNYNQMRLYLEILKKNWLFLWCFTKNNYFCGICSDVSTIKTYFQSSLNNYTIWIDQIRLKYEGEWEIWKYGIGIVDEVYEFCDLDYARIYYPDIIKSKGFNVY